MPPEVVCPSSLLGYQGGTLAFAAGDTRKTGSVPMLDHAHDEARETLTFTLQKPSGAPIADGSATGTIGNADPLPRALLARSVGRRP